VEDMMNNKGKMVNFQPIVHYNGVYLTLIGFVAFFTQLRMLHVLRYHKTISILSSTLSHAFWDLIGFGVLMGGIFVAYTIAMYSMFHELAQYSDIGKTICSQVEAILGKFSLYSLINYGGNGAGIFMMLYLYTTIIFLMNFFVAILNNYQAAVTNSKEMHDPDFKVMDYFLDTIKKLVVGGNDEQDSSMTRSNDTITCAKHMRDFETRIDSLLEVVEATASASMTSQRVCDAILCYAIIGQKY
jgi:hypothetical protein